MNSSDDIDIAEYTVALPKSGLALKGQGREKTPVDISTNVIDAEAIDKDEMFSPRTKFLHYATYSGEVPIMAAPWVNEVTSIPDPSLEGESKSDSKSLDEDDNDTKAFVADKSGSHRRTRFSRKGSESDSDDSFVK